MFVTPAFFIPLVSPWVFSGNGFCLLAKASSRFKTHVVEYNRLYNRAHLSIALKPLKTIVADMNEMERLRVREV